MQPKYLFSQLLFAACEVATESSSYRRDILRSTDFHGDLGKRFGSATWSERSSAMNVRASADLGRQNGANAPLFVRSKNSVLRENELALAEKWVTVACFGKRLLFAQDYGSTSIDIILNLFQEAAINHISLLGICGDGLGTTLEMNRHRLIWVITRLHVEVERYVSWTWAMMNQDTRKLSKLLDDFKSELEPIYVKRHAIDSLNIRRIPNLEKTTRNYIQSNLTISSISAMDNPLSSSKLRLYL